MKRFLALFLCLIFGMTAYAGEIPEPQKLYAQSAVLMDAESGRVLFEKNADATMAMASTTKIMTCILALEKGNMEDVVTVTEYAAGQPKVHLGMKASEQFYLKDLLYSLMLESHNDSAVAIAEHLAGSVETFATWMNQKAEEIGCKHTYFITPNGLDAEDENGFHSTTAADLAKIMSYCIMESSKKEDFLSVTATVSHNFSNLAKNRTFSCNNKNYFLNMMEGAISGKTGFTNKAGYCYVGAVERDERTFVVALLACGWPNNKNYKWQDTRKLMEYAIENYTYRDVYEKIDLPEMKVEGGIPESNSMYEQAYVRLKVDCGEEGLKLLLREDESVEVETQMEKNLVAPVREGKKVGSVSYYLEGVKVEEYPIVLERGVEKKTLSWYFMKIAELYFGMV